jgi:hypothetical protein
VQAGLRCLVRKVLVRQLDAVRRDLEVRVAELGSVPEDIEEVRVDRRLRESRDSAVTAGKVPFPQSLPPFHPARSRRPRQHREKEDVPLQLINS